LNAIKEHTNHRYSPGNDKELAIKNKFLQENNVVLPAESHVKLDTVPLVADIENELDVRVKQLQDTRTNSNAELEDMVLDENDD
jgi:hypothetical protein